MTRIDVFDPPMCCSTGVCGPSVDPRLTVFAADLQWLSTQGVAVTRHDLAQDPQAFLTQPIVTAELQRRGDTCLPLILVNGELAGSGVYPSRDEMARLPDSPRPPATKEFLRSLQPELRFEAAGRRILLVHGSPRKINEYLFEDRPLSSFQRLAASANADIIAFGHTHKPYVKHVDGVLFLNVGSVGKPKDGDWRACYAVLEVEAMQASFRRLDYDVAHAASAIRATDLPHEFAADIETGGRSK